MNGDFWEKMDAFVPVLADYLTETRARQQAKQDRYYADISSIAVSLKRIAESVNGCRIGDELKSKDRFESLPIGLLQR